MNRFIILTLVIILVCLPSFASGWETIKSDHFTIFYKNGYEAHAREFLNALEYYRPQLESLTGNTAYHLPIVVDDIGTMSNGMTDPFNYRIFLYTYPPAAGGLGESVENWHSYVGVHEYTHLLHTTKVAGMAEALKLIFGDYYIPNFFSPGWAIEGITVYSESQISRYQGRLNDGYYDSYIGTRVKDNRFPPILKAAYSYSEYPYGDGIYNYGGVFFNYLSKTYGEDKFAQFFENNGSWFPVLMFGSSAKQVYGKSFPQLWDEWKQYESNRFKDFHIEGERLTRHGWWISNLLFSNSKIYYARSYIKKTGSFKTMGFTKIMEKDIQTGNEKSVVSTTSFFTTPIKVHNDSLYYAVGEGKFGYANASNLSYGFYSVIHEKNLTTGEDRVLLKDGIRDFEVLKDKILCSKDRKDGFGSEISQYEKDSGKKKFLFNSDYLVDKIVSDGSRIAVSARKDWESYSLYSLDLEKQEFTLIVNSPYFEGFHSLYDDKLFFTANYGGVYSNYCYDFSAGKVYRLTENEYAAYPAYDEKSGILYYVGLNSYGHDVYAKYIDWNEFQIPDYPRTQPPVFSLNEKVRKGTYFDNLKTLIPRLRIPFIFSNVDSNNNMTGGSLGALLIGEDALGHFPYAGSFEYDFVTKKPGYDIALGSRLLAPFTVSVSLSNTDAEKRLKYDMQYPFFMRLSPGLSGVSLGLSGKLFKDFNRHELTPYLITGLQFPTTNLELRIGSSLEREQIGSTISRTAFTGEINLRQYIKSSEANIKITGVYDPDSIYNPGKDKDEDNPFPEIRGYKHPLDAKIGALFSADFSAPLLPIKWGVWFPPYIYFEDICGDIFVDGAIPKDNNYQLSTGLELHLETNFAALFALDIGVRFFINRTHKKVEIEPIISGGGAF